MDFADIPRITDSSSQVNGTVGTVSLYTILYLTATIRNTLRTYTERSKFALSNRSFMNISDSSRHFTYLPSPFGFRSGTFLLQEE